MLLNHAHIWRDIRDVLVSSYHYEMRRFGKSFADFAHFYWGDGRSLLFYHMAYMRTWQGAADDPRVFQSSYAELRTELPRAARDLIAFTGIGDVDLRDLEQRVSIDQLRQTRNDPAGVLLRRGIVGESREVIDDDDIYRDIARIEGLSVLWLYLHAALHRPKDMLKHYYPLPGKRALRKLAVAYRTLRTGAGREKQAEKTHPPIR